jgi:hypothetical protein
MLSQLAGVTLNGVEPALEGVNRLERLSQNGLPFTLLDGVRVQIIHLRSLLNSWRLESHIE